MIKLVDIIKEAKQVGILYHWTNNDHLFQILKSNTLESYSNNGDYEPGFHKGREGQKFISFTRTKNKEQFPVADDSNTLLIIDGDKLSNNYRIIPFQTNVPGDIDDEMEERIYNKNVTNFDKYLIKVIFYEDIENEYGWVEEKIEECIEILKEKNIPYEIK